SSSGRFGTRRPPKSCDGPFAIATHGLRTHHGDLTVWERSLSCGAPPAWRFDRVSSPSSDRKARRMDMLNLLLSAATESLSIPSTGVLENMLASLAGGSLAGRAFELQLPGRPLRRVGRGETAFRLTAHNQQGLSALASLDERRIGEAYLDGALDLDGDLTA